MKFCPLCFKMLIIEGSTFGNRLICKVCRYFYSLAREQKIVIKYDKNQKLEILEENQEQKALPITQTLCPKCSCTRAYFEQRQTRSADQASTLFFTCVDCSYKWNEN